MLPPSDVIILGYCSPTAFFHEHGEYIKEQRIIKIDFSRKILIFVDQPHTDLLQRLRPLLSHDKKEIISKITDKNRKGKNKTKTILLIGFPVVVFCSAGLKMDEQEITRMILLSPEISNEKIKEAIMQKIERNGNENFVNKIENNPERIWLKKRIETIKNLHFSDVLIYEITPIWKYYSQKSHNNSLNPSDMRNIEKLYSIIKGLTLLNFPHREIKGKYLIATQKDVEIGLDLWKEISIYQEIKISPFILNFYKEIFLFAYKEKNKENEEEEGIKRKDLLKYHSRIYGRVITDERLRKEIIPALRNSGLIREEKDPEDKREKVYFPNEKGGLLC